MTRLSIFDKNFFFQNLELLYSVCGLSASAAYTPVFTVYHQFKCVFMISNTGKRVERSNEALFFFFGVNNIPMIPSLSV